MIFHETGVLTRLRVLSRAMPSTLFAKRIANAEPSSG
jgi:hypothetical protein